MNLYRVFPTGSGRGTPDAFRPLGIAPVPCVASIGTDGFWLVRTNIPIPTARPPLPPVGKELPGVSPVDVLNPIAAVDVLTEDTLALATGFSVADVAKWSAVPAVRAAPADIVAVK